MGATWRIWCAFLAATLFKHTESGVSPKLRRSIREVYPEVDDNYGSLREAEVCVLGDVVYTPDEVVPAEQPCLRCKCQPPGVHCETIKCGKRSGCKAVHHPNKCCPDYQCECYHDDKVYANGERLKTSDGDCNVCYCRGGEIQCTQVSCYLRSDCEGKQVPGQCCPKYDHCPLKEATTEKTKNGTSLLVLEESTDLMSTIRSDEVEESEVVPETQQPPSVLKIGDKLLFLKKGDVEISTPVITIIGAEGLQIGFEESEEYAKNGSLNVLFNNSNDLEPKVAESTHILSLVKHKKRPEEKNEEREESTVADHEEVTKSSNLVASTTEASTLASTDLPEALEATTLDETTTVEEEELVTESVHRSIESIEDTSEESGENTTPRNSASLSTDVASIETSETDESHDMTHPSTESEIDRINDDGSQHLNVSSVDEVELVEEIRNETLKKKRQSSVEDEADEVFKQLAAELSLDTTETAKSAEEENQEAEKIFQELIDETRTPKPAKAGDKNAESVQKITDAVGRVVFGGRREEGVDVLGVLSNLFNFQHRFGKK